MVVHSAYLLGVAREARDRAVAAVKENSESWPSDANVAIILAAASTEAFINELAELVAIYMASPLRKSPPMPPQLPGFAEAMNEIEGSHGSVKLKYLIASQTLRGEMFDKGAPPYQDFDILVKLRNDHMHLKPIDTFTPVEGGGSAMQPLDTSGAFRNAGLPESFLIMLMCRGLTVSKPTRWLSGHAKRRPTSFALCWT
jgi:hypothetical protein